MSAAPLDRPAVAAARPGWYVVLACALAALTCIAATAYGVAAPAFRETVSAFGGELPLLSRIALQAPHLAGAAAAALALVPVVLLAVHLSQPRQRWTGRAFWILLACALPANLLLVAGLYLPILSLSQVV
ncbi:hypothetical protein LDO26_12930 [Luteimonas sp. BDR2-5]|uniref:hypothetical protein n=1 Tax=Proluteimonas luteida TaxID=2878685 RepID=UPI001E4E9A32|nr:hypothetical protein [Luteimonas sp. BDR2-5]MCD9029104.1 hypothetical protein [Luteimonas sp. BDR2-5]